MEQATPFSEKFGNEAYSAKLAENVLQEEFQAYVHESILKRKLQPNEIEAVKVGKWVHIFCDKEYAFQVQMTISDSGKRIYKTRK